MLHAAKAHAKKIGVPFSITVEDFEIPKLCRVLGIPLKRALGKGCWRPNSPSLDRKRGELGYVPGNVAVISFRANRMKNDATLEEVKAVLRYMKS